MIGLDAGDWRLELRPDLGGAIGRLTFAGEDILRPTPDHATDALETACFPLIPYANRIADGRFTFDGREVVLPVLPRFAPHALHGDGWRAPWAVTEIADRSATLTHAHAAGAWPWAYTGRQRFDLTAEGLTITLSLRNDAENPMPAGLGLHPFIVAGPNTRLRLRADTVWTVDERLIPESLAPTSAVVDWSSGVALADAPPVDHCYAGWDGVARIADDHRTVTLTASPDTRRVQVYTPAGEPYCCIEPVTHRPDAIHAPADPTSGLVTLAPGETLSIGMRLSVGG